MTESGDGFAERLASLRARLEVPPDVMLGVLRLPILDPILEELDAAFPRVAPVPERVVAELSALAELLLTGMLGTAPETAQRRVRVIELLRRADGGRLPTLVADPGDAFGAEVRVMLASDDALRMHLGLIHPLTSRATSVAPSARWRREARALAGQSGSLPGLIGAVRRVLAALIRAEVVSRPDILVGGLRPANQRFARGLLWFAAETSDSPSELLAAVGLRMGTSGRSDAVVRDTALANTAAALLGESRDAGAIAALADMRLEITNRNVLKQVDRALAEHAKRGGTSVTELVDASLPSFGLDPNGHRELAAPGTRASLDVHGDGRLAVTWLAPDGTETAEPSPATEAMSPALVAEVAAIVDRIEAALAAERRRLDLDMGSVRRWPFDAWQRRFALHPIGRVAAASLIWSVDTGAGQVAALPLADGWLTSDERALEVDPAATIGLWHPADATSAETIAWRATLAARAIRPAIPQADREVFRVDARDASRAADLRHAGTIVEHARLRAALRRRGWAVPALGGWDQGDEATAWRAFDDGLRAELRYQSPDRVATGERVEQARLVAVRFVRTDTPPASPAPNGSTVTLAQVPARVFSESLRDVALVAG